MAPLTGRPLAEYRFLRLLVEYVMMTDPLAGDRDDMVAILSRCFGCARVLTAEEQGRRDGVCAGCRKKRGWERN